MLGLEGAEIGGTMMAISVPALKVFADRTISLTTNRGPPTIRPIRNFSEDQTAYDGNILASEKSQIEVTVSR